MQDRELIRRALAGDQRAFDALYRLHRPRVYGTILRRAADREEAEDLMQVTFMQAFHRLERFRGDAAFSTYRGRIVMNVCATHRRLHRARQGRLELVDDLDPWSGQLAEEAAEERTRQTQRQELVALGIQTLPPRYREAMRMRYVQDRSYEEITQTLRVPIGTVKTWLWRARQHLKGMLESTPTG